MSTDDQFLSNRHPILLLVIVASISDFNGSKLTFKNSPKLSGKFYYILRNPIHSAISAMHRKLRVGFVVPVANDLGMAGLGP